MDKNKALLYSTGMDSFQFGVLILWHHIFLPFHAVHGFSRQEYQSGSPFPSPVNHVLSEFSTMSHPSWVGLHSMAYSFISLHKSLFHDKAMIHEE